jgi:UDP-2,3-diacylglucosamine pyrophosphatase LpxH
LHHSPGSSSAARAAAGHDGHPDRVPADGPRLRVSSARHHYLVVSDLHLADVEDHGDCWKAYKGSRFLFDEDFATLLDEFRGRHTGGALTLILNGDIFDFDLVTIVPEDPPWPVRRSERVRGLNPTAEKSAWKMDVILKHHPRFVTALAAFVTAGHQVVYVLGNHDRELHFPEVRQVLNDAVTRAAREAGTHLPETPIRFEPWFYCVPGEIYVEHGHQFDPYNSFKNVLSPTVPSREGPALALPMGNLSNRYLMTRMGYFNPHASDFILNFFHYVYHWARFYLFSRRSLILPWFVGSLLVISKLLRLKRKLLQSSRPGRDQIEEVARRFELPADQVERINKLHLPPIINKLYRMMRELWLDRVLIALFMTGGTITLALVPIPLWIKLMVPLSSFPLLYFIYEWLARGDTIFTMDTYIPERARAIAELLPVRVITFGHTHRPRQLPLRRGVTFVDTGTWAPITDQNDCQRLAPGFRNTLEVSFEGKDVRVWFDSRLDHTRDGCSG